MYHHMESNHIRGRVGSGETWIHVREIVPHAHAFAAFIECAFILEKQEATKGVITYIT